MSATDTVPSCANVTATDNFLIHILGSLYRQFLYRLAAYQVTASLLHAIIAISQFAFLNYDYSKHPSCVVVGYLYLTTVWMKTCFGFWITFHLFCFAILLKNTKKLEPLYVVTSILFPIAISSVPLATGSYGPTGEWCWMEARKCDKAAGFIEQIALWSGPAFVVLILQSIAMLTIMITVYYRAYGKSDHGRDQYRKAFKQLLPLVAYPVLFCILVTPPLIARVYGFAATPKDLGQPVQWLRVASLSRHLPLLLPKTNVSTDKGIQTQPRRLHFSSLATCLRTSAADAADPAITLASFKVEGFSADVMVKSNAAGLPNSQLGSKMSAGRVRLPSTSKPLPASI
ncbi:hypothetical protein EMCRGX_G031646 [Ephydatia muelleri]